MAETGWFVHELRVRYAETDRMGVVHHTHYLTWFEAGRTEMIRSLGVTYEEIERMGLYLPLTESQVRYLQAARYDDWLEIRTRPVHMTPLRLDFAYEVRRGEEKLAEGVTKHVWLNRDWKPVRLDKAAPELYRMLERAAPFRTEDRRE